MPLSRYRIKNEYGLADPELYRAADKDDPEAILEGVAMVGLVGLLRQLGDLAEFAAEIFHNLHEEVMATAARSHGLLVRVHQLETEIPSVERTLLSQTSHSSLLYNSGGDWHPNLRMEQNLITQGDLPRFIMDSYEECRGPPRLFLLDKFDVAGAGACLKRYTDPSFLKVDGLEKSENQRENAARKAKKKRFLWKNGGTPQALPKGQTRLHDLLQEERVQNHVNVPAPHVKLKKRLSEFPCNLKAGGRSYMEKFLELNSTELDVAHETSVNSTSRLTCNRGSSSLFEKFDVNTISREEVSLERSSSSFPEINDTLPKPSIDRLTEEANYERSGIIIDSNSERYEIFSPLQQIDGKEIEVNRERKMEATIDNSYQSDEITSDVDNYMDALATIDSDVESDVEYRDNSYKYLHKVEDSSKKQENLSDLPDSEPVGSFSSLTDHGNLSSSGELSEFSSEGIESGEYGRVEGSHTLSKQTLDDLQSIPTKPLERICNDIHVIGEEQLHTSSSLRTDSYTSRLSLDLEGSFEGDASEHSESSEECSINNNELFLPSDATQSSIPASSECHLEDQDEIVTSPIIRKTVPNESNKFADSTKNSTVGNNAGDAVDSCNDKMLLDVLPSKDSMVTITRELDIDVKDSFDSQMDPFHFAFFRIDEQPESIAAQGEKQLEFSEEDSVEKPQMVVSHAEEHHQFSVSHSEEESQLSKLSYRKEDHNHLVVSNKEDQQFVVSHSEEESQFSVLSYTKENHNQLVVSNKEDQPQLGVLDIEMQRKSCITQEEEQPQLTSHQKQPQLTSSSEEPSSKSLDAISPVEFCLKRVDNLEVRHVSEADDGENVGIFSDVLCDEATTNTAQSEAKAAVSVACDKDDIHLLSNCAEESQPVEESIPSSYFVVKPIESPNNFDQEEKVVVPSFSRFPSIGLPSPSHTMFDEMPPLPPLPPVQWRMPKVQHAPSPLDHIDPPMMSSQLDNEIRIPYPFSTFSAIKEDISHHEFNLSSESTFSSIKDSSISDEAHLNLDPKILLGKPIEPSDGLAPETSSENDKSSLALTTKKTKEVDHPHDTDDDFNLSSVSTFSSMKDSSISDETHFKQDPKILQEKPIEPLDRIAPETRSESEESSLALTTMETKELDHPHDTNYEEKPIEPLDVLAPETSSEKGTLTTMETKEVDHSHDANDENPPQSVPYPSSMFAYPLPEVEDERLNGGLRRKLPLPRNPLIDAVVALDKTKLRKVTERHRPPIGQKCGERDTLLEEIRTKSYNLRPTTRARPSIEGPKTNLRVAAILEKAISIRQAHAGSDDDDDSWSDS